MYNNPYLQNYAQQSINDKIDNEIARLQQMKNHNSSQPAINQTFQLAPTNNGIKFVNGVEEVQKELAIYETPFIDRDYSTLWIKNAKGQIRTFNLEEIELKDEKEMEIESLKSQINNLNNQIREMKLNEQYNVKSNDEEYYEQQSEQFDEPIKAKKSTNVSNVRTSKSKSK